MRKAYVISTYAVIFDFCFYCHFVFGHIGLKKRKKKGTIKYHLTRYMKYSTIQYRKWHFFLGLNQRLYVTYWRWNSVVSVSQFGLFYSYQRWVNTNIMWAINIFRLFLVFWFFSSFTFIITNLFFSWKICTSEKEFCPIITNSVKVVPSCPTSKAGWDNAAYKKNCSKMVPGQNCHNSQPLLYHCVINAYENETLEVCAPQKLITGNVLIIISLIKKYLTSTRNTF